MAQKYETKTQKYNIVIILKVLLTRSRPYFLKLNKKAHGIARYSATLFADRENRLANAANSTQKTITLSDKKTESF